MHVSPYLGTYYYVFNVKRKPFDDPRVRHALSLAVDRDIITGKVLKTGELPAYAVVPPKTGKYGEPYVPDWSKMSLPSGRRRRGSCSRRPASGPTTR